MNTYLGEVVSIFYTIPFFFQGLTGLFVTKFGFRIILLNLSYVLFLIGLIIFLILPENLIKFSLLLIPFVIIALGFTINSPIGWSCVKFEVDEQHIGTAFGVLMSLYNLVGILLIQIYAYIVDYYSYYNA